MYKGHRAHSVLGIIQSLTELVLRVLVVPSIGLNDYVFVERFRKTKEFLPCHEY